MKKKEFQNKLKEENLNINIEMSNKVKDTPIALGDECIYGLKKRFNFFRLAVCLACFIFMSVCVSSLIFQSIKKNNQTVGLTSYILEVNPSICITTDKNDNVINVCALNDDANIIVSDESMSDFKKFSFEECIGRIMRLIDREGYFENFSKVDRSIKLYAFSDSNELQYDRLKHFEKIMQDKMGEFGFRDVPFEKHRIGMDDFRKLIGIEDDYKTLDDMGDYFKHKSVICPPHS